LDIGERNRKGAEVEQAVLGGVETNAVEQDQDLVRFGAPQAGGAQGPGRSLGNYLDSGDVAQDLPQAGCAAVRNLAGVDDCDRGRHVRSRGGHAVGRHDHRG
jgi:hypothetical protein